VCDYHILVTIVKHSHELAQPPFLFGLRVVSLVGTKTTASLKRTLAVYVRYIGLGRSKGGALQQVD
jgi:hypothetical protein